MAIEISADDVARAEAFLETLLTQQIPEGRFTQGSALRDLVIKSLAFTFGHLQKETATLTALRSLLTVRSIATTDPDVDRAVNNATDAILSNWFITRKTGSFARVPVFAEVAKRQDYIIPGNHRFLYDRDHVFYPDVTDTTQSIIIRASDLLPVVALDGTVKSYQFSINVIAAKTGTDYNVAAGTWQSGTGFSPFATRIFTVTKADGGKGRETTTEVVTRSNTAIAVRNLINPRSIDATLREKYSSINRMLVTGMGDPEMTRDLKIELATNSRLHVGGHFDVYMELPRVQSTFEGRLGGTYTRPDGLINVFRDATIADWTTTGVQPGDVIRTAAGLAEAPRDFVIKEVFSTELRISTNTPFSVATDETASFITYFIYRPLFLADAQILPSIGTKTTGVSSRQIKTDNRLILPGGAHYEILDVMVTDPDTGDPFINPADGFVHFPVRSNETPNAVISAQFAEYQIVSNNPGAAQSQFSFEELILESDYNGKNVRVKYETLVSLDTIHNYLIDRFERVLAGSVLGKGYNPVYLSVKAFYRKKPTATGTVDEESLRVALVAHINTFDPNDVIDVSDISTFIRNSNANIGFVAPLTINYELIAPDGRLIRFVTQDSVAIDPAKIDTSYANSNLNDPLRIGLSDRTVRYMTTLARISVEALA